MLDRSDDGWLAVIWNISKERQVWIHLGQLIRREGVYPLVSEMFYWAVVQAVLLFRSETWFLLEKISKKIEGVHVGFLR